jgi:excisionase family DNA binding protein
MSAEPFAANIAHLKPSELAAQLGVSRAWLYDAAKTGHIPSIRIGGEEGPLRFVSEDIQRWIDDARAPWCPGCPTVPTRHPATVDGRSQRRALPRPRTRTSGQQRLLQRRLTACAIASSVATALAAKTWRSRWP